MSRSDLRRTTMTSAVTPKLRPIMCATPGADLMRVGVDRVVVHHGDVRRRGRDELIARAALQRIGEARIADDDLPALRPRQLAEVLQRAHVVVEHAVAGVQVGAAVAADGSHATPTRGPKLLRSPRWSAPSMERNRQRELRERRARASRRCAPSRSGEVFVERAELHVVAQPEVERQRRGRSASRPGRRRRSASPESRRRSAACSVHCVGPRRRGRWRCTPRRAGTSRAERRAQVVATGT